MVSLPFAASAASRPPADAGVAAPVAIVDGQLPAARARVEARGGTIMAGRNPTTIAGAGTSPVIKYTLSKADSLDSLANYFGVSQEAIAFANGITDPSKLETGRQILIPPLEGALYTVAAGDTVESVAERFKVKPDVIRTYNRLYFEPEYFAPGQLILVQNAALPSLALQLAEATKPTTITRPSSGAAPAPAAGPDPAPAQRGGTLAWPVNGVVTQNYWAGHTGLDVAAPFGTGIISSIDGVVSANGWVAVGGLRVCITSGSLDECYYHTGAVFVSVGQKISKGQVVASIGMTGVTTGPHVHWETKINGIFQNPLGVIW